MVAATFEQVAGLGLTISGSADDIRHFDREYGAFRAAPGLAPKATLAIDFAPRARSAGDGTWTDGHKTVAWTVGLSPASEADVRARISLRGQPASFARSLVQGYVVEPLMSVVAAELGSVQLPAAGVVDARGLHVLIGRSRAGKSTLAARSLAAGGEIIGDDQVFLDTTGAWRPFPRRLRLYPDIRETAPTVWGRLAPRTRALLRARRAIAALTGDFVRPSLGVGIAELGGAWDARARRAVRIVLLERSRDTTSLELQPTDVAEAVRWATAILEEQRGRLSRNVGADWLARLAAAETRERAILTEAMAGVDVKRLRLPDDWGARRAIDAAAVALGLAG
jgi:hypothetical protein